MTLPKSVQSQSDAADAARSSAYEAGESEPTTTAAAQPTVEPEPAPSTPEPETRDATYWRNRFEVIQGKYNKEVKEIPVLRQEIKDLKAQLEQANSQGGTSDMKAALLEGLPENVVEEYGSELIDAIAKIAANAANTNKPTADPEIETLKTKVNSMTEERQQERQAQMMTDLEIAVPDWEQLQNSKAGQDWLYGFDSQTGRMRNKVLVEAAEQFQTQTVINIFKQLKSEIAGRKPPENQVQPTPARSTTQTPAGGRTWTRDEINQFYKDRTQPGRYTDEQAKATEQDIFLAQSEGRIIG